MHEWEAVRTWRIRRRSYHRRDWKPRWRTEWRCARCGTLRQLTHGSGNRHPVKEVDAPPPDFKHVQDQGKTVLGCEDLLVREVMQS